MPQRTPHSFRAPSGLLIPGPVRKRVLMDHSATSVITTKPKKPRVGFFHILFTSVTGGGCMGRMSISSFSAFMLLLF